MNTNVKAKIVACNIDIMFTVNSSRSHDTANGRVRFECINVFINKKSGQFCGHFGKMPSQIGHFGKV